MSIDSKCGRGTTWLLATVLLLAAGLARGQEGTSTGSKPPTTDGKQPFFDDSIDAAEGEEEVRGLEGWNHYKGPYATLKMGMNAMYDNATYSQDENSKTQVGHLGPSGKVRDFRVVFSGTFPKFPRVTWKTGLMWDGANERWLARETGLIIDVPKLKGHLFIGRTKEGFSMVKHMVGTSIWGIERQPFLDAAIPIMADGIRWMGYSKKRRIVWNLGFFDEKYSQSRHTPYFDRQVVARVAYLPYAVPDKDALLHVGLNMRYAVPQDDKLTFKARPESTTAPFFIDAGSFQATETATVGPEVYYRKGPFLAGGEYYFEQINSKEKNNPIVHGGDVMAVWALTGETRSYSTRGGLIGYLVPATSVFKGGKGAWETVLRFSYTDANDGVFEGGKLWRGSALISWYLNGNLRITAGYGYGDLDRFGINGRTHFFQSRVHLML